jgi:hypothetical protein
LAITKAEELGIPKPVKPSEANRYNAIKKEQQQKQEGDSIQNRQSADVMRLSVSEEVAA